MHTAKVSYHWNETNQKKNQQMSEQISVLCTMSYYFYSLCYLLPTNRDKIRQAEFIYDTEIIFDKFMDNYDITVYLLAGNNKNAHHKCVLN
jgi:hypothetical protein